MRKRTAEDYHQLAKERNLKWLGTEVINVNTHTTWQCLKCGHKWDTRFDALRRSKIGCPACAGSLPLIPDDYHNLAESRGFKWLGPEVPNNRALTRWECENGHEFEATYGKIQSGRGCKYCSGNVPLTPEDYINIAKERGLEWLGPEVPNNNTHTGWRCLTCEHEWETVYISIQRGASCPECGHKRTADARRLKPEDYHLLGEERGYIWLGPPVDRNSYKTNWICSENHFWHGTYADLQQGSGCPICGLKKRRESRSKYTDEDYHKLAASRGYKWIGKRPLNANVTTAWSCITCGYKWRNSYQNLNKGSGCPRCSRRAPIPPEGYHKLAEELNLKWLGPEVSTTQEKTEWECSEGHRWISNYNNLSNRRRCPSCHHYVNGFPTSSFQREICQWYDGELNRKFGRYGIDIAIVREGVKIAIEYDGYHWHQDTQEKEARRNKAMQKAGWKIIRIRSGSLMPKREELDMCIQTLVMTSKKYIEIRLADWPDDID